MPPTRAITATQYRTKGQTGVVCSIVRAPTVFSTIQLAVCSGSYHRSSQIIEGGDRAKVRKIRRASCPLIRATLDRRISYRIIMSKGWISADGHSGDPDSLHADSAELAPSWGGPHRVPLHHDENEHVAMDDDGVHAAISRTGASSRTKASINCQQCSGVS